MAFGITRKELNEWKKKASRGEIAFLTHYWVHPRYPQITTVTKAGCQDIRRLIKWGQDYGLAQEWIDEHKQYPHFDLIGDVQRHILKQEKQWEQIKRFHLE